MRLIHYPDDMESKFEFIAIAALRCSQLQKGATPRVTSRSKKFTTIAQEEVLADQVEHSDEPIVPELPTMEPATAEEAPPAK